MRHPNPFESATRHFTSAPSALAKCQSVIVTASGVFKALQQFVLQLQYFTLHLRVKIRRVISTAKAQINFEKVTTDGELIPDILLFLHQQFVSYSGTKPGATRNKSLISKATTMHKHISYF